MGRGPVVGRAALACSWMVASALCARAQQVDSVQTVLFTESDTAALEATIERSWDAGGLWRTRFQHPGAVPASFLGGILGWQSRLNLQVGSLTVGVFVEKNPGEPLGPTSQAPWVGPERKQVALSVRKPRWEMHVGPFRQHTGFGIVAGRSRGWAPALSNPLSLPDILPQAGARLGSASEPVPSGLTLMLRGPRGRTGLFHGQTWHAASVRRNEEDQWVVSGPSGTTVFATRSSLDRRRRLGIRVSGWTGAMQGRSWKIATLVALASATSRMQIDQETLPLDFPGRMMLGSVSAYRRVRTLEGAAEWAASGPTRGHQWSLRWRPRSGSGLRLGHAHINGTARSPIGEDARFRSSWLREDVWQLAAAWRRGQQDLSVVGAWRSRKAQDTARNARTAVAWSRRSATGSDATMFLIRDKASDERWRWGTRLVSRVGARLTADVQLQMGLRRASTEDTPIAMFASMGLRAQTARWDAHVFTMRRTGGSGSTLLYAAIPTMQGGFPMLGGASDRWFHILRLRHRLGLRMDLEGWLRWQTGAGSVDGPLQGQLQVSLQL